jgi:hypothetical protein
VDSRRTGRPPKEAEPGTRVSLGLKVTAETKALIDKRARQSGRTQSQEAELLLDQARMLASLDAAGPAVADTLQVMLKVAKEVGETIGSPTTSVEARDALRARWVEIAKNALPNVEAASAAQHAATAAISAMRFAAISAYDAIAESYPIDLPELGDAPNHLLDVTRAKLHPGSPAWPTARTEFVAAAKSVER